MKINGGTAHSEICIRDVYKNRVFFPYLRLKMAYPMSIYNDVTCLLKFIACILFLYKYMVTAIETQSLPKKRNSLVVFFFTFSKILTRIYQLVCSYLRWKNPLWAVKREKTSLLDYNRQTTNQTNKSRKWTAAASFLFCTFRFIWIFNRFIDHVCKVIIITLS